MEMKGRRMISLNDFTTNEIEEIVDVALEISEDITGYGRVLEGCIMGALFYEASTRTRLSFESAMLRSSSQATVLLPHPGTIRGSWLNMGEAPISTILSSGSPGSGSML